MAEDLKASGRLRDNNVTNGTYTWKTYAESLDEAGVSWKCYQGADNYGTNVLENFKQFQNAPTTSSLYQNAMTTQPYGQFEIDAMNDNLPAVSWLFPTSTQSEHPNYLPNAGAAYVASKIDAPEVWAKTVFILTYDAFRFNSYAEAPKLYDTSGPLQVAQYTATEYALPTAPDTNQSRRSRSRAPVRTSARVCAPFPVNPNFAVNPNGPRQDACRRPFSCAG